MKQMRDGKKERVTWGDVFPKYRISMLDNGKIKRVRVEGAKKLLLCIEREVKIHMGTEIFKISGQELSCINYTGGAIEISGKVDAMFFEETCEMKGSRN